METFYFLKTWLVWGAVVVSVLAFVVALTGGPITKTWKRASPFSRFVFVVGVIGITLYGGSKGTGSISYPFTDPEARYLYDAGSYVTNDAVHVAFTRLIAPPTATLYIDRRRLDLTNDTDWVNHMTTTFAEFNQPRDISFLAATNWNWVVYTTWTPGPTVRTNGVWHAYWGLDKKAHAYFVPVRTCVRMEGEVIATPKSRWDAGITNETEVVNE